MDLLSTYSYAVKPVQVMSFMCYAQTNVNAPLTVFKAWFCVRFFYWSIWQHCAWSLIAVFLSTSVHFPNENVIKSSFCLDIWLNFLLFSCVSLAEMYVVESWWVCRSCGLGKFLFSCCLNFLLRFLRIFGAWQWQAYRRLITLLHFYSARVANFWSARYRTSHFKIPDLILQHWNLL